MGRSPDGKVRFFCIASAIIVIIFTAEKQIFDFLGYMWAPMLGNFLNIIFAIFLCFGSWHRRSGFLACYLSWCLPLWIPWNVFLICYYTELGGLKRSQDLLTFGTRSFSWWLANGYGCKPEYFTNSTLLDDAQLMYPIRPSRVTGCLIEYNMVEVLQSAIQLSATALCCLLTALHFYVLVAKMNNGGSGDGGKSSGKANESIYSIEYSTRANLHGGGSGGMAAVDSTESTALYSNVDSRNVQMTPRRVKRRSYTRSSARSARSQRTANKRSTLSSLPGGSLRLKSTNPVTRLIEAADNRPGFRAMNDSSTSNDEPRPNPLTAAPQLSPHQQLTAATAESQLQQLAGYGQINPAYESSRPNSIYSNGASNRPPSALTSYSNFHGQRKQPPNQQHHNLFTQENLTQQQPPEGATGAAAADTSFEDLPPPPPPLDSAQNEQQQQQLQQPQQHSNAAPQAPVPQQRGSSGRFKHHNEYVNMPIVQQHHQQQQQQQQHEQFSSSTLRADGHLLNANNSSNDDSNHPPYQNISQQQPPPLPVRANGVPGAQNQQKRFSINNTTTSEDDYGFSGGSSNPQPQQQQQQQSHWQQQQQDKWYLQDSMRPVGAPVHGGNCKCYRCQRKLTAI